MGEAAVAYPAALVERGPRIQTREYCVIVRASGACVPAVLVNLSEQGFCVEAVSPLRYHEVLTIRVLGTYLVGRVRWTDGSRAGASLLEIQG